MNEIILRCEGIKKDYCVSSETLSVLKGVNFECQRGGQYFIVGRSGSGKSTLLHILGGLDTATEGTVYFCNNKITSFNEKKLASYRNKNVGFVFQFFYLIPELTVWENVMLPGLIARKKLEQKTDMLLTTVGLTDRRKHLPTQLSGGELQRVALARALVNDPDIVFCDEPTGNLDEENAMIIYDLIDRLNKTNKQTFCIVTHEESVIANKENAFRLKDGVITAY